MNIKITSRGTVSWEAAETALKAVNGRAKAQAITNLAQLKVVTDQIDRHLAQRGVALSNRPGTTVWYTPAGPAKSYKYTAKTTAVELYHAKDGWRLKNAHSVEVWPGAKEELKISVPPVAREAIQRWAFDSITDD